jgi:uncharacterized OB-fold protein
MSTPQTGTVHSVTTINLPGRAHAADAPFVLVLVDTGAGRHMLGHFSGNEMPPIGARVAITGRKDGTPVFSIMQGQS